MRRIMTALRHTHIGSGLTTATAVLSIAALGMLSAPAGGTVYTVDPQGGGDFPTIQAAVAAAISGDVIELTDGVFAGDGNRDVSFLGKAITIRSRLGDPSACVIDCGGGPIERHRGFLLDSGEGPGSILEGVTIRNGNHEFGGALSMSGASPIVRNCILAGNTADHGGAIYFTYGYLQVQDCVFAGNTALTGGAANFVGGAPNFLQCTFAENEAGAGGVASMVDGRFTFRSCTFFANRSGDGSCLRGFGENGLYTYIDVDHSILGFGQGSSPVACHGLVDARLSCCDVFGNEGGDWVGCLAGQEGGNGNINDDPLFCGPDDFTLAVNSPCAPENNPQCGLIGAWPVGCDLAGADNPPSPEGPLDARSAPNPFRAETSVTYVLQGASHVVVNLYDVAGHDIRTLVDVYQEAGSHSVSWNGLDRLGNEAPAGVYFARIETQSGTRRVKMLLAR